MSPRVFSLALAAVCAAAGIATPLIAQSQRAAQTQARIRAEIDSLQGAMPKAFDIVPADPCAGIWTVVLPNGQVFQEITVLRYRNLPLAHLRDAVSSESVNLLVERLDPRAIQLRGGGLTITLRCAGARAIAQFAMGKNSRVLNATLGPVSGAPVPAPVPPTQPGEVRVFRGDIQYVGADGITRTLTQNGDNDEPVLSPDGRTVAFVHVDRRATEDVSGTTSLWVADVERRTARRLLTPRPDTDEPKRNLASFQSPRFSLDGGFVYIDAASWATSNAVHQVNVQTGEERFVTDGSTLSVIRSGPYRGHLLVSQHRYRKAGGSYDPISVVRPDGTAVLIVPGTDGNGGDNDSLLEAWLTRNGWQAW
ncbi:MAG: hypothetical protein ABW128_00140 [Rhizorhabdus sp.]